MNGIQALGKIKAYLNQEIVANFIEERKSEESINGKPGDKEVIPNQS